jgi:hypothetical protein
MDGGFILNKLRVSCEKQLGEGVSLRQSRSIRTRPSGLAWDTYEPEIILTRWIRILRSVAHYEFYPTLAARSLIDDARSFSYTQPTGHPPTILAAATRSDDTQAFFYLLPQTMRSKTPQRWRPAVGHPPPYIPVVCVILEWPTTIYTLKIPRAKITAARIAKQELTPPRRGRGWAQATLHERSPLRTLLHRRFRLVRRAPPTIS